MISEEEFLEIFRNSNQVEKIPEDLLFVFYRSIEKSVILLYTGLWGYHRLLALEEDVQWPVLEMIDDPNLDIYKVAVNKKLVNDFIKTIKKEKEIRREGSKSTTALWKHRNIINTRTELYKEIFSFTKEEIAKCKEEAKKYHDEITEQRKAMLFEKTKEIGATIKNAISKIDFHKKK